MKRTLVFLLAGAIGAGLISAVGSWKRSIDRPPRLPVATANPPVLGPVTATITEEKRKVFPYSIVPGGALSVQEARRAMSDPAVRNHYAAFDLKNLKQV